MKHWKLIKNLKFKIENSRKGLTLIELIVAIFIFSILMVSIVAVFVSTVRAHGKARAVKTVKENAEFALASIAKDVRMGRILSVNQNCRENPTNATGPRQCLMVTRNRSAETVCYRIDRYYLGVANAVGSSPARQCPSSESSYDKIIDLSASNMEFKTPPDGGFYSAPSDPPDDPTRRGWVEINLNIDMVAGEEMEADSISVQTTVSSRDYGWEEVN